MDATLIRTLQWSKINGILKQYFHVIKNKGLVNDFDDRPSDERRSVRGSFRKWYSEMKETLNFEALATFLLLVLPNIERLEWQFCYSFSWILRGLVRTAARLQLDKENYPFALAYLREIELTFLGRTDQESCQLECFLELPSLRTFVCNGYVEAYIPWDGLHLQQPVMIERFMMIDYQFGYPAQPFFSAAFEHLKHIEFTYHSSRSDFNLFHIPPLLDSILLLKKTLQFLKLIDTQVDPVVHESYKAKGLFRSNKIPSLFSLGLLRSLEIQEFMFEFQVRSGEPTDHNIELHPYYIETHRWDLADLPVSLQRLVINDVVMSRDGHLAQLLKSPKELITRLPCLKQIHIGFLRQSLDNLEEEDLCMTHFRQLTGLYAIVGITMTVKIEDESRSKCDEEEYESEEQSQGNSQQHFQDLDPFEAEGDDDSPDLSEVSDVSSVNGSDVDHAGHSR